MTGQLAAGTRLAPFSATRVTRVVKDLLDSRGKAAVRKAWSQAVAARVATQRPDLADVVAEMLDVTPAEQDILAGLTIGEVSVCYEALLAEMDGQSRRASGQFFTPDDAAQFMAEQATNFPAGVWLDPCTGVGNLAWHLAAVQADSAKFVGEKLILMDRDETALLSAVALIGADYLKRDDTAGFRSLRERAEHRDALTSTRWPNHDYVIVNPPYARDKMRSGFKTARARESFSYFMERVANWSSGYVSVTPASYTSAPKFTALRKVIKTNFSGGNVFVFDNVPDTLFRGYKYGSSNTSRTNFVRAAITVVRPEDSVWQITPIIRWRADSRARMFASCATLLAPMQDGPGGEWAKVPPGMNGSWSKLTSASLSLKDLRVPYETEFSLTVATTPRYYISASYRDLERGSKAVLYFKSEKDRSLGAVILNSALPYIWWRALDGGVTLPRRVLLSVPIPDTIDESVVTRLANRLRDTEGDCVVTKLNAGRRNENVKRPQSLVAELNKAVLPDGMPPLDRLFAPDMFPATVS